MPFSARDYLGASQGPMNAMESAANQIRKFMMLGDKPQIGKFEGRGGAMLGVKVEMGQVLYALSNLGMAVNQTALKSLLSRGGEWQASIRQLTPQGPPRDAPQELGAHVAPRMGAHHMDVPVAGNLYSYKLWQREAMEAIEFARKEHGYGAHDAADAALLTRAGEIVRSGALRGGVEADERWQWGSSEEGFGSLWSSITVRGAKAREAGSISMEAFSTNYYAGYVNDGFNHGLAPRMRMEIDGKLRKGRNFKLYTQLGVARLGEYGSDSNFGGWGQQVDVTLSSSDGSDQQATLGFSYSPRMMQLTPGSGIVDFTEREEPKHQEGVHMFERGTEIFLTRAIPGFLNDMDKIVTQAWNEGKAWYAIDRQYRVRKGLPGAGQFAGKRPSGGG